jgi:hypothetical protein
MCCCFRYAKYFFLQALLLLAWHCAVGQSPVSNEDDSSGREEVKRVPVPASTVESEIGISGLNSFGHVRLYAASVWDYLKLVNVEYERHSWGRAFGARMDYSAAFAPVMLLSQPAHTDVWAGPNPKGSTARELAYGIGVAPIGVRMMWFNERRLKPFFVARGGFAAFDKKAISQYASYLNFTLEIGLGTQFRISPRWDGRVGFSYYHISNAFIVPVNPGLDSMTYTYGISYRLKKNRE